MAPQHSVSFEVDQPCASCGVTSPLELWALVDAAERPDLLARIHAETLNELACPSCGHRYVLPFPLLVFLPEADGALVMAVPRDMPEEAALEATAKRLSHLKQVLGEEWGPSSPPYVVEHARLPEALIDAVLQALTDSASGSTTLNVIEAHPELLSEAAQRRLQDISTEARAHGKSGVAREFDELRALLSRCAEVGALSALAESSGFSAAADLDPIIAQLEARGPHVPRQRVEMCQRALELLGDQVGSPLWGSFQGELGNALLQLPDGSPADNAREALTAYEAALPVFRAHGMRLEEANTLSGIGNAQRTLVRDEAGNLETAIRLQEQALRQLDDLQTEGIEASSSTFDTPELIAARRHSLPAAWSGAAVNLAVSYLERLEGDRRLNVQLALRLATSAQQRAERADDERVAALAAGAAGLAYLELPAGDPNENLERAIERFEDARRSVASPDLEVDRAGVMLNLGVAYLKRRLGDPVTNIERAVACFHEALAVTPRETRPLDWGKLMSNLADALSERRGDSAAPELGRAVDHYRAALEELSRERVPLEWATTSANLARVLSRPDNPERDPEAAQALYRAALDVLTEDGSPHRRRTVAYWLGELESELGNSRAAADAYRMALAAGEQLYLHTEVPSSQQLTLAENEDISEHLVRCGTQLDGAADDARALLLDTETAKARTLRDQLGQVDLVPPPSVPAELLARESELLTSITDADVTLTMPNLSEPMLDRASAERAAARRELEAVWTSMLSADAANGDYVETRRGGAPRWVDVRAVADAIGDAGALVCFYLLDDCAVALVMRAGWTAPRTVRLDLSRDELWWRYLQPYIEEVLERRTFVAQGGALTHDWLSLGDRLLAPLDDALGSATSVVLVPHGPLHLLPLHALRSHGTPLIAQRSVSYVPSIAVLSRILHRTPEPVPVESHPLVLGYTPNVLERTLFVGEAQNVARRLGCTAVIDEAATPALVRSAAPRATCVHLSCHGSFSLEDPLDSALALAGGDLSARDWMRLRLNGGMVVLSACRTGFSQVRAADEAAGLPRAVLYAGASSAVFTLWSVSAPTTMQWMSQFYSELKGGPRGRGKPRIDAFRDVTLDLMERFDDPYHWAPFTLIGDWR